MGLAQKDSLLLLIEGLFVLRPVCDLDFVSVFNLWAHHKKAHFYSL
jgi:hypothetical protein